MIDTLNTPRVDYVNKQTRVANWVTRVRIGEARAERTGESNANFFTTEVERDTRQTETFEILENIATERRVLRL